MSVFAGPNAVENGLILCLDAANSKSYPGSGNAWTGLVTSNNGTLGANTTYNSSGYFTLDATSSSIIATTGTTYPSTWSQPVSFEIWTYFDSDGTWHNTYNGGLFSRGSTVGTLGLIRRNSNNSIGMWLRSDSGAYTAAGTASSNQWTHIVGTWDGISNLWLYINGTGTTTVTTATGSPDVGLYNLGGMNSTLSGAQGNVMKGRIALARMYNRVLTSDEVQQNFNALRGRFGL
jgi:hypothetical protein